MSELSTVHHEGIPRGDAEPQMGGAELGFHRPVGCHLRWGVRAYFNSGLSYVAKEKGQIVGFVFAQMVEHMSNIPKMVLIEGIGVHPSHQRKGIGYQLLKKACEEGKKAGAQAVQSAILPENAKSMMLHKKLGFFLDARKLSFLDLDNLK